MTVTAAIILALCSLTISMLTAVYFTRPRSPREALAFGISGVLITSGGTFIGMQSNRQNPDVVARDAGVPQLDMADHTEGTRCELLAAPDAMVVEGTGGADPRDPW